MLFPIKRAAAWTVNRYVGFHITEFFWFAIFANFSGRRNGRRCFSLAMTPLAQGVGRITDPTGTQFGDIAVNHSE